MALQAEAISHVETYVSTSDISNKQKVLDICNEAIELFPESKGAKQCESIRSEILQKELLLSMQNVQIPNKDITAELTYRNLTNPHYRIYKVSQKDLEKLNKSYDNSELVKELFKKELIAENHIEILDKKDYQEYTLNIKLPKLDYGTYFIMFSKDDNFSMKEDELPAIHLFQVSNLSFVTTKEDEDFVIYVLDRDSGKPLENVNVNIYKQTYDYDKRKYVNTTLADLTTDKNGTAKIPYVENNSFYVNLFKDGDMLSDRYMYFYNYPNKDEKKEKTFFFTDRAIYRPGQTVHFKGVILNENLQKKELFVGKETTVILKDSNWQDVASQTFTTNEFGSFDGSFVIPNNVSNGYFQIKNESGSIGFKVEEYKRPTFEITFENPDKSFKLNDEVELSGSVRAYAGFGLDNVNYKYKVVRRTYFPYRYWRFANYYDNEKQIVFGDGTTDKKGDFNINFKLVFDEKEKDKLPVYEYIVTIDVTNAQGETQSKTYTLKASDIDLIIDVNNRSEIVFRDSLDLLTFDVKNLKENPVEAKLIRKVYRLDSSKSKVTEPVEMTGVLTSSTTKSKYLIYNDTINVNGSYALFPNVKNLVNIGRHVVELISVDNENVKTSVRLTIIDLESDEMPCDTMCISYCDKESAQPSEDVNFYLGSSAKDVNVYVMIKHGNEIRYYKRKTISDKVLKFSYKIKEEDRGRISFQAFFVKNNTINIVQQDVLVPYDNLKLDIRLDVERDDLQPGSKEKWSLTIRNFENEGIVANLLAGMYDASLDVFAKNSWYFPTSPDITISTKPRCDNSFDNFFCAANNKSFRNYSLFAYTLMSDMTLTPFVGSRYYGVISARQLMSMSARERDASATSVGGVEIFRLADSEENIAAKDNYDFQEQELSNQIIENQVPVLRENFDETAFFYPNMITNDDGSLTFSFTMPDALTRWNLMMLAYTKGLKTGTLEKTFTTSKPLMIMSDMPRFCYENDTLWIVANVVKSPSHQVAKSPSVGNKSVSEHVEVTMAKLEIFDALTMEPLNLILSEQDVNLEEISVGQSRSVRWKVAIGKGATCHVQTNLLALRFSVNAENFSDSEQHLLPILSDEVFMTETYPMTVRANSEEKFNFGFNNENERNQGLTLNFCANPKWYAIQSLQYLSQEFGDNVDVAFNIFYANSLAAHIAHNIPNLLNYIKKWQIESPDVLMSQLQKDENLKAIMLQETPWVLEAKNDTEQKSRIANLFDINAMSYKTTEALNIIKEKQSINGGWSWLPNMPESSFITQNILSGFGKLYKMNVINDLDDNQKSIVNYIGDNAIKYLTNEIIEAYSDVKDKGKFHSTPYIINELYALSFFDYEGNEVTEPVEVSDRFDKLNGQVKDFFLNQLKKDWQKFDLEMQAKIALVLHRNGDVETSHLIMGSLKERVRQNEDVGAYWSSDVKSQTAIMEALREISPDPLLLEEATIWLLCNKRCNMWENAATTVNAIYELMIGECQQSSVNIKNNSITVESLVETYGHTSQNSSENSSEDIFIQKYWNANEMGDFKEFSVNNKTDNLIWGGLFRQYFVSIDEVRKHESPLNVERELFVERVNENGSYLVPIKETALNVGDKVVVNLTIESEQEMEFVFLKDLRAACLEPTEQMSRYNYSDGMSYYQINSDTFMGFYFDRLPKGKHRVSYSMFVTKEGSFSNGYSFIQCMYAPEFSAYSSSSRIVVEE